jgi:multidrug transporter EmrE-like cation transporter
VINISSNYIWLFTSIFLGACGQLMLKFGTNQLGQIILSPPQIIDTLIRIFTNLWVFSGIIFFVSSMILWIKAISVWSEQSHQTVSLTYLMVCSDVSALFHESVSLDKVLGMVLVCAGVYFLNI